MARLSPIRLFAGAAAMLLAAPVVAHGLATASGSPVRAAADRLAPAGVRLAGLELVPSGQPSETPESLDRAARPPVEPAAPRPESGPDVDRRTTPSPSVRREPAEGNPFPPPAAPQRVRLPERLDEDDVAAVEPTGSDSGPTAAPNAAAPAPVPDAVEPLPALSRAEVRDLQVRLTLLGHNTRGADGLIGPNTRKAVRAFQASAGLSGTGEFTGPTVRALEASVPEQEVAAYHARVQAEADARARARAERRRREAERARQQAARRPATTVPATPPATATTTAPSSSRQPVAAAVEATAPVTPKPEPAAPKPAVAAKPRATAAVTERRTRTFGAEPEDFGRGGK